MDRTEDFKIDFIGIGTPRAATTWLSTCLKEHPEICLSKIKETNFFSTDKKYEKGIEYYKSYFLEKDKVLGEFSVEYLASKKAAHRIKKHFPNTKLIVNLRNPADRIYSLYWWNRGRLKEKAKNFEKALKTNKKYLEEGFCYNKLKEYYSLFNKNKIFVILLKDIKNNPSKVIKQLYSFLGVDENYVPEPVDKLVNPSREIKYPWLASIVETVQFFYRRGIYFDFLRKIGLHKKVVNLYENINRKNRKYPAMNSKTRKKLIAYYKKDIKKTAKLINRDLSHWLK